MPRARAKAVPEVPEEYAEKSDGWKRAFSHASGPYTSVKAAVLYADSHGNDKEFTDATETTDE